MLGNARTLTSTFKKTSQLVFCSLRSSFHICLPTVSEVVLIAHCFCFISRTQSRKQIMIMSPYFFLFYCCRITPSIVTLVIYLLGLVVVSFSF